jgi:hypothetical protein
VRLCSGFLAACTKRLMILDLSLLSGIKPKIMIDVVHLLIGARVDRGIWPTNFVRATLEHASIGRPPG